MNVGGITIHSFAGIGAGTKGTHELISIIKAKEEARKRWEQCSILVFDEVSMLSRELSEKLEQVARHFKKKKSRSEVYNSFCQETFINSSL